MIKNVIGGEKMADNNEMIKKVIKVTASELEEQIFDKEGVKVLD